ncbi:serine/threonine-protein phosphatase 4 regulatory subunit 2 isoform X5 [Peromyscus maniculatus bairdii]
MNGVMFPGNSPNYTDRSNINGPGTPRPLNRPKLSLSASLTTNGLPESTDSKESDLQPSEEKVHSDSPGSESEVSSLSPVKNKHPDEDAVEAEEHEVKRLRFDKEGEVRETASQTVCSDGSGRAQEAEAASSPPEQDRESRSRRHCTEEEEEEEDEEEEEEEESFMTPREIVPERKNQEKESEDTLAVNEEPSEEGTHMEDSDRSPAQRDPPPERRDSAGAVRSGSDCLETDEPGGPRKAGEGVSGSPMENDDDETTDVTDEPMEQDLTT